MRSALRRSVFLIVCMSVLSAGIHAQQAANRPNVLFIVVDDMNRWGLLNDYAPLKAPAIRKLASESYYFSNATCAAPICIPSRASFLSGKYPHHSGVYRNVQGVWQNVPLLTEVEALPEVFKRNGYATWGGGKTFHIPMGDREKKMFDNEVFHGGYGPFATGKGHWNDVKPWEGPDSDFTDVVNADAAVSFLKEQHNKPFFMYYGLYRPHSPYTAPKRFYDLYEGVRFPNPPGFREDDLNDVPPLGKEMSKGINPVEKSGLSKEEGMQTYLRAYCANASFADWNVGRVLQALDESPYAKNTIVIFISDNGFHNGTKNHWAKSTLWEQADAIPFLIRVPGGKAYTCPQTVSLVDIYPTLVEYCRLSAPHQQLDGKSIVPVFKDPEYKWERHGLTTLGESYSSVRSERYRYIRYPDGSEELYDHKNDPYEHTNLASRADMRSVIDDLSPSIPAQFEKSAGEKKKPAVKKANQPAGSKRKGKRTKRQ